MSTTAGKKKVPPKARERPARPAREEGGRHEEAGAAKAAKPAARNLPAKAHPPPRKPPPTETVAAKASAKAAAQTAKTPARETARRPRPSAAAGQDAASYAASAPPRPRPPRPAPKPRPPVAAPAGRRQGRRQRCRRRARRRRADCLPRRRRAPQARARHAEVLRQAGAGTSAAADFPIRRPLRAASAADPTDESEEIDTPRETQKADPKLANAWKTKAGRDLTEAEILAMPDTEYMNEKQLEFFRAKLQALKDDLLSNAGETTEHLREDTSIVPDPADRATIEEEHALELRTRDRERKLLKKISQSLARIESGDYGFCDETGEPIGLGRLIARPTATLSLEAQQRRELKQKMFGD